MKRHMVKSHQQIALTQQATSFWYTKLLSLQLPHHFFLLIHITGLVSFVSPRQEVFFLGGEGNVCPCFSSASKKMNYITFLD